uniref:Uncharacterized protein n=1 Tax=Oryza meridionalis TaxID=40149 RepID=A0A0E0DIY5_9ORYZ
MHTAALHSQAAAAATSSSSPPLPAMTRIPNARDGGDPLDTEDGFWSSGDQRSKDSIEVAAARCLLLVLLGNGKLDFPCLCSFLVLDLGLHIPSSSHPTFEIGDFENWMKIMDFDCKSINAAVPNIYQS